MDYLVPVLLAPIFLGLLLVVATVMSILFPTKSVLKDQLEVYQRAWQKSGKRDKKERQGLLENKLWLKPFFNLTSFLAHKRGLIEDFQLKLDRAGVPLRASEFIFLHFTATIFLGFLGYFLGGSKLLVLLFIGLGATVPLLGIKWLEGRRNAAFHNQLPDTLTLIAGALKAGYSFLQAVDMVTEETYPPMSTEFKRVLTETRLGLSLEEALNNMASRVESTNFDWSVMAVKIQREVGGNLAEILEVLAETIRERDRVKRQVSVLTAEGRLSAIILFLLPFILGLVLFFINRSYILTLLGHPLGWVMIGMAVVLMAMGGVWLKKVVTIEV